jgi:hypothetical protein
MTLNRGERARGMVVVIAVRHVRRVAGIAKERLENPERFRRSRHEGRAASGMSVARWPLACEARALPCVDVRCPRASVPIMREENLSRQLGITLPERLRCKQP